MTLLPDVKGIFKEVLQELRPSQAKDTDLVRIYIDHDDLRHLTVPITITPRQWGNLDENYIMAKLEHVLSSKQSLSADSGFQIHVASITVPTGSAVPRSRAFRVICHV